MKQNKQISDLVGIFNAGIDGVNPDLFLHRSLRLNDEILHVQTVDYEATFDLKKYKQIFVVGFGKASAKMAAGLETLLDDRITKGIIVTKYGHSADLMFLEVVEAGHPIPDANGLLGAKKIMDLAHQACENTLFISLISGGGSALIPMPFQYSGDNLSFKLSLQEKQQVTQVLLDCGATINEINCIRKHLSGIKGGRLSQAIAPATSLNLILSDVVGDRLDAIASGTTAPDRSSFEDMKHIIQKYAIKKRMPTIALGILNAGLNKQIKETPSVDCNCFSNTHNVLIGTNAIALHAAKKKADSLGFETSILTSELTGEAKEVAKVLLAMAKQKRKAAGNSKQSICILSGGETTVTIKGTGKGGRNQEMALSMMVEMAADPDRVANIYFLSAGTDGNDGPTDAAGAFACSNLLHDVEKRKLNLISYLNNNDAYHLFEEISGLFKTGPTNTNVCDVQIFLIV